jgi:tRNA(adenine34) deaminase
MPADDHWMGMAMELARQAAAVGEVPVGAVIVSGGEIIGCGQNRREQDVDPTAHAELVALRQACRKAGSWRLPQATLYVTLEPCMMCLSACCDARIRRICFGALDSKRGAVVSNPPGVAGVPAAGPMEITTGILAAESSLLLGSFFKDCRQRRQ